MKIATQLCGWLRREAGGAGDDTRHETAGVPDKAMKLKRHNFKTKIVKMSVRQREHHAVDQPSVPLAMGGSKLLSKFPPKQVQMLQRATSKHFLYDGSFQEAVGPVLAMAQCFAVMPLRGVKSANIDDLQFTWRSIRTVYAVVMFALSCVNALMIVMYLYTGPIEFARLVPVVFNLSNAFAVLSFGRLGMKWPRLMKQWDAVERQLPQVQTQFERSRLAYDIKMISIVVLTLSLFEHLLCIITIIHTANKCNQVPDDPMRNVMLLELRHVFYYMRYSTWMAVLGKVLVVQSTFVWSFMDLFVMIISIGLVTRFRQINRSLLVNKGCSVPERFWVEHRIYYRNMCDLCETIDREIGHITLVSFSNNLWFICVQLLNSLNDQPSIGHALYFWYSLIFLITRTLAVSLYSADINDESKEPLKVFRSVPPDSWCLELKRFSTEVTRDVVALSGMRFFHLTRTLVLSVAGTIITYELVLVQFHTAANTTEECHLDVLDLRGQQ